jgi:nucleoside-triphosphatase THEP1
MGVTIVTGPRDSGKTRTASDMASRFQAEGRRVAGVISVAELRDGTKAGYAFHDLGARVSKTYARRRIGPVPPGGLAFEFLDAGMDFGRAAIRRGCADGVDALFIDEVGPLEMGGEGLWEPLWEARSGFEGELVLTVRPALLAELLVRLSVRPEEARIIRL